MPLCGTKKSKKQKRDPSPPYRQEVTGETEELRRKTKSLSDHNDALNNDLKQSKNERRVMRDEITQLKKELQEAKVAAENKPTSNITDGSTPAVEISTDVKDYEVKLQSVRVEIEEQQAQKKTLESEKVKLEGELKATEQSSKAAEERITQLCGEVDRLKTETLKIEEDKDRLKKEKDVAENQLSHTTKELEIARKESHIPRSPTRAPSEEWKNKIETAEAELANERQQRLDKERENSRLNSDKTLLEEEKDSLQNEIKTIQTQKEEELESLKQNLEMNFKNDINRLEENLDTYRHKLEEAETMKDSLLTRLSAATAANVLDNNPNIADLSDPNRPQKLGEQLSQVYDDQWTDATEALEKLDMNEEDILNTLLNLIVAVYKHCKEAADTQLSRIEEDLFLPPLENAATSPDANGTDHLKSPTSTKSMSKIPRFTSHKGRPALPNIATEKKTVDSDTPSKEKPKRSLSFPKMKGKELPEVPVEVRKGIKEYRKKVTRQVWPVIEKEVINKLRQNEEFGDRVVDGCKSYISKCVELCWLMRVQDPPVCIDWKVPDDRTFDTETYRAYTKSGSHVEFVVWPAVYLHDDGPILMKGVAQGLKS